MNDLVGFLKARLAEDEQVAREASIGGSEWPNSPYESAGPVVLHSRRHDPARVLAEVAAKRAILARLAGTAPPYADSRQQEIHETLRDEVVPHLAAVHASHESYRPEWMTP